MISRRSALQRFMSLPLVAGIFSLKSLSANSIARKGVMSLPMRPYGLTVQVSHGTAIAQWHAPTGGGLPSRYQVRFHELTPRSGAESGSVETTVVTTTNTRAVLFSSLLASNEDCIVQAEVRSENERGCSGWTSLGDQGAFSSDTGEWGE